MKNSGIEWIGNIPDSWSLSRLQWHLSEIKESNDPVKTTQVLSLTNKLGVIPYEEKGDHGNKAKENLNEYKLAYPGTIVANSMNILIGSVGKCDYFGCVSPVYYVFKPNDGENIDFLNYVFQTEQFQKELRRYANGILEIRLRVSASDILKRQIAFPSSNKQKKIVDFLNIKTEQINKLIEIENNQIENLKEYKQSLITEIITNGLDNSSTKKDSNIEWIGKISNDASIVRLKYYAYMKGRIGWQGLNSNDFIDCGPFCITGTDFSNGGINWDTCYHVSEERYEMDPYIQVRVGDLLITKDGTIGKLAKITHLPDKACLNSHLLIIRPLKNKFTNEYLYYVLSSGIFWKYYNKISSGAIMASISQEKMENFSFPVYDLKKQEEIVRFLDLKCKQIDLLIDTKIRKIDNILSYKKSLIYEYITGKKEVS